jgi:hypothetical protein
MGQTQSTSQRLRPRPEHQPEAQSTPCQPAFQGQRPRNPPELRIPFPSSEYTRRSPVNPIDFKISKPALDNKIQVVDQKITYFKKQVEKAKEDITRVYTLTGAERNETTDDGMNLFLNVAKDHKSHVEDRLKKAQDEKKEAEQKREKLIRTSRF